MQNIVDLTSNKIPAEDEMVVFEKKYDNGQPYIIKEIQPINNIFDISIEEKQKLIKNKKIELQYKLVTNGSISEGEKNLLQLLTQ